MPCPLPAARRVCGKKIAAIQERDLKNVYDLSVSSNLEEVEEPRFAAKLDELAQPCEVDDGDGEGAGGEAEDEFTGSFLETGVSERREGACFFVVLRERV